MTEQKKTTKVKKKRVSIADLQSKPKRLTLVHPDESIDVGDAWVELIPPQASLDYMSIVVKLQNMDVDNMSFKESLSLQADMILSVVNGWNEEEFGGEYSPEGFKAILMNPENMWIGDLIRETIAADSDFFTKV